MSEEQVATDTPPVTRASAEDLTGSLEITKYPTNAQASLLVDEAIASFTARNRMREALSAKISKIILEGKDPAALVGILDKLCTPDDFTKQILGKIL